MVILTYFTLLVPWEWSGVAKVSCILRHRGIQLILAYSWARAAILVVGKGLGVCFYFFFSFTFITVPLSSLSLSFISSTISSISFLPFSGRRHKMTHKGWRVIQPQHNQSIITSAFNMMSQRTTIRPVWPAKTQNSLYIRNVWSETFYQ